MEQQDKPTRVIVTNLDIEFGTMIVLMIKFAIAAIPAAILLALIVAFGSAFLGGMLSAL